jgi:hypothetical protein
LRRGKAEINSDMRSLLEQERLDRERLEREEKYKKLLGVEKLPKIIAPKRFKCSPCSAIEILTKGGYHDEGGKSWVRYFNLNNENYRYHAYVVENDLIELHTDKSKKRKSGKRFHIASTYLCAEERARLKSLIPKPITRRELKRQKNSLDFYTAQALIRKMKSEL